MTRKEHTEANSDGDGPLFVPEGGQRSTRLAARAGIRLATRTTATRSAAAIRNAVTSIRRNAEHLRPQNDAQGQSDPPPMVAPSVPLSSPAPASVAGSLAGGRQGPSGRRSPCASAQR